MPSERSHSCQAATAPTLLYQPNRTAHAHPTVSEGADRTQMPWPGVAEIYAKAACSVI